MAVDDLRSGTWVTYVSGRATSARLRRCRIEVVTGADAGLVRDIEASVIRIGARRGNDVQLTDSKVSGLHCEIRLDDRGYRLRDLDSTNGTYVSQLRVNDVYIQPGAQIALGGTRLRFEPLGDSVESELSGHERGAFTGAATSYAGAFERAHGGTVFLDEIGELPLAMQPKLLRVLERKEVRRVGGSKTVEVDLRVVAATNRDLGVEVNRGRFREDLYYRLAVARVHVPPLRERKDDLPLLIDHILATTPNGETASIAQETIDLMMKHDWPGNVRELRNVIERAVLLAETPEDEDALRRTPAAVPRGEPSITATPSHTATSSDAAMTVPVDVGIPFKLAKQNVISEFEKRYISRLLAQHDGNISAAARAAGIDRMSIHKML